MRNIILFALSLIIFIYFACVRSPILGPVFFGFIPSLCAKHLFGTALLIMFSIFSINRPLQHVKWNKIIFVPQILMGLGIVVTGFLHPIGDGYQTFGFMLLFVFPCLYFVWNNRRDYDVLFSILICAMILANFCLYCLHYYYSTIGQLAMEYSRISGLMYNSNNFSLVGLEMVLGAIYLFVTKRLEWAPFILLCFAAGTGIGIILIGKMRLAIIILFLCISVAFFFYVKYCDKRKNGLILRLFVLLIIIFQMVLLSLFLVQLNYAGVNNHSGVILTTAGARETDTPTTEATQEAEEQTTDESNLPEILERFNLKGKDANSFSSGRFAIWSNYARELNLLGNNYDEYDKEKMTSGLSNGPYAHDIFLEIGYRCGIPVGLLSVFTLLVTGILALTYLFCNRNRTVYLLYPIIAVISYAVLSLLDCAVLPFFQAEVLLYYFAMIVFIDARVNK